MTTKTSNRPSGWVVGSLAAAGLAVLAGSAWSPAAAQGSRDTLRVGMYSKTQARANPFTAYAPSTFWFTPIYDTLVRINQTGEQVPWAAESWTLVDPLTWRFTLRPGMQFSNGQPLDAGAVAETIRYLIEDDRGKATNAGGDARAFAAATAIDARTVELKTKAPNPVVPRTAAIFFLFEPGAWRDLGPEKYAAEPVTSGPYRVERWSETEAQLVAFDKAWRPAKTPRLTITELPESVVRLQSLLSNQIDIAIGMGPDEGAAIKAAGHQLFTYPSSITMAVALHTTDFSGKFGDKGMPFNDRRVRQAFNHAVDRDAIVRDLLGGNGTPAGQPGNSATFGYNPAVKAPSYDPAKARALLAEAGYANGFDMTMEIVTGAQPKDRDIYQFVADSLKNIGVRIDLRQIPAPDYLRKLLQGTWEGQAMGLAFRVEPTMDLGRPWNQWSCRWPKKFVCIDSVMPLIDAAEQEMDPAKRRALLQQLAQKLSDESYALFLVSHMDFYGVNRRVRDFDQWNLGLLYERMSLAN